MQERWLSVSEIAAHLGVNPDTIYKWIERKKMPAHKVGRLWKFLASEVDQWVKGGRAAQDTKQTRPRPKGSGSKNFHNTNQTMNAVIKPWLSAVLIIALAGNVLPAVLIVKLSRFDDTKKRAEEAESLAIQKRTELSGLKVEIDSLTKQKDALAPTVADWEKRLKEKATAEASLAALEAKHHQTDSDVAQAGQRLEELSRSQSEVAKLKADITTSIESLKSELAVLTKTNVDAKAQMNAAAEAEQRYRQATNGLANADARRKQLESDGSAAQTRFEQIQKEADDMRQSREKLTSELAALRQQTQTHKDLLATFDQKAADLKAIQTATQQEEQKFAKSQQQLATAEARATEMESRQRQASSELAQLTNRLEQARSQTAALEIKRDTAKTDFQKAEGDLVAARKLSQEFSAKQSELTRDVSRLETTVERLKKEKETLEKEIGRQEAQRQKSPPDGQK